MLRLSWLPFLTVAAIFSGCGREEDLRVYDAEKSTRPVVFNTPDGWHRGQPMRSVGEIAAWEAIEGVHRLRITAGYFQTKSPDLLADKADLLANINRWREQQVGLDPITEADLERELTKREINGDVVHLVRLEGPPDAPRREAIWAALFNAKKRTWFLKLRGPLDAARAQQSTFDSWVPRAVAAIKHAVREPTEEELAHGD